MSEWKKYKLENLVIFIDGDRGKNYPKQDEYLEKGYCLFLNTSNVTKEGFNFSKVNYISESKDKLLRNGRLEFDDIILTTRGTIGNLALYREYMYYPMRINSSMLILKTKEVLTSEFLYYLLKTQSMQFHMRLFSSGSAQPQLPVKDLKKIEVMIPSRKVQDEIVSILSNYDKLIENNNRRIEILEQTAEELYKEWFVRMRFPGYENAKFDKGIPEGWEVTKIGEMATFKRGKNLRIADAIEGDVPVIAGGIEPSCYHNESNTKAPVITVSASGANAGYTRLNFIDVWASDCSYIDAEDSELIYYIYLLMKVSQKEILNLQLGSAQPHVYARDLNNFSFLKPPQNLIKEMNKQAQIIFNEVKILNIQNQNLTKQRDLLLPRLMNGTITVK